MKVEGAPPLVGGQETSIADLVDEVDAILWIADPRDLRFLYVSKGAERILGYPVSEWLTRPDFWVSILHPDDRDRCVTFCREQIGLGADHEFRYRAIGADGQEVWLRDNVRVEVDASGNADKIHGVMFDITDRQARSAQQAAVGNLGNLALSSSLSRLYDEMARATAEILRVDRAEIVDVDAGEDRVHIAAVSGPSPLDPDLVTDALPPDSWTSRVLAAPAPLATSDLTTDSEQRLAGSGLVSAIGMRILGSDGRPCGSINAYSATPRRFTSDEAHFLSSVATVAASAITRADVERELKRKENQLETAQEVASLGSWEWVPATGQVWWSKELFAVHGQEPESFVPSYESFIGILHKDDRERIGDLIEASVETRADLEFEYRFIRADHAERLGHALARCVIAEGDVTRMIGTVKDVTESKQAELRVENSERRLRAIFDNAGMAIATVTPSGTVLEANPMLHSMLGYPSGTLTGKHFADITHPEDVDRDLTLFAELLDGKRDAYSLEKRFIRSDGGYVWGLLTATVARDEDGQPIMAVGMVQDITVRQRALQDLMDSRAELSEKSEELARLTRRLVEWQEIERRNIAHDLHDEVGQILTGLKLALETAPPTESAVAVAGRALPLLEDLISLVRDMTLSLRPPMLDDLGLLPTLDWHISRYEHTTDITVRLTHRGIDRRFEPNTETAAYRMIQEALTNVVRHAHASEVSVEVEVLDDRLCVKVADQGVGFDKRELDASTHGLLGMRERLTSLGGEFILESAPGAGTTLIAKLPIDTAS